MAMSASNPVKASHRFLLTVATSLMGGGKSYRPTPAELDRVSQVFVRAGGSWARLFRGSVDDVTLAKRVMRVAAKQGYLTPQPDWSP
jgi:hypothetical protein